MRMSFAGTLRALMDEREISGRALARKVPCDPGYVSRLASGKQRPSLRIARRLDELLGAGGGLAPAPPRRPGHEPGPRGGDARRRPPGPAVAARGGGGCRPLPGGE